MKNNIKSYVRKPAVIASICIVCVLALSLLALPVRALNEPKSLFKLPPKPDFKVEIKLDEKGQPKVEVKVDNHTDSKGDPKSEPNAKSDTKAEGTSENKADSKASLKADLKAGLISELNPEKKVDARSPPKSDANVAAKPDVATDSKSAAKIATGTASAAITSINAASVTAPAAVSAPSAAATPSTSAFASSNVTLKSDSKNDVKELMPEPARLKIRAPSAPANADTVLRDPSKAEFDRLLRTEDFKKYDKPTVRQIQADLAQIYHRHPDWIRDVALTERPLTDDLMGPVTMYWMQRYCVNFKVEPIGDFAVGLPSDIARIATFSKAHPTENDVLISVDFALWNVAQAEPLRSANYRTRRSGNDAQLLDLVRQYLASKSDKPTAKATPVEVETLTSYTYVLTADDITKLQGKDQLMLALATLKDQGFPDLMSFKKAVNDALAGFPGSFKKAWPIVENNVVRQNTYEVTDASLLSLSQLGLSASTMTVLEGVKDTKSHDKVQFYKAVYTALKAEASLKSSTISTDTVELPETDSTTMRVILRETEQASELTLTEDALGTIEQQLPRELTILSVPAGISKLLKEMQDVSYPDDHLLHRAAQARMGWGIAACMGDAADYNKYVNGLRLTDIEFKALKQEWLATANTDAKIVQQTTDSFASFEQLRKERKECNAKEREALSLALTQVYRDWVRPAVSALYQKKYIYQPASKVQWTGGSCGCVLDNLAGTVYGFYPYWKVDGKEQAINFSVLSRVAYYGLSFDEIGEIKHVNNTTSTTSIVDDLGTEANAFLNVARRHHTKVDWVIEKNDWQGAWSAYSASHKAAVLDKLAGNIERLLTTELTDSFSKVKPYISLGSASVPTRGDGVTLYFKDYPFTSDDTIVFNKFFEKLKLRLAAINPRLFVNVLVSQAEIGRKNGIYDYANLLKLTRVGHESINQENMNEKEIRGHINSHVLVLLDEPSSGGKKALRKALEDALHGAERKDLLLSILPVLVFDNKNWPQLQDDLIYFDEFGGLGFWPLSIGLEGSSATNCADAKNVSRCIALNFEERGAKGETDSALKKFVCQNRWWFRTAFDVTLLLLVVGLVLYFRSCSIRSRVIDYFPLYLAAFGLPPITLFTLLLFFDPNLASMSRGNLPFIICLTVLVGGAFGVYVYLRGQQDVPSRSLLKSMTSGNSTPADSNERSYSPKKRGYPSGVNLPSRAALTTMARGARNLIRRYTKK